MKLKIELLSDLCTYSGDAFNSYVDTDVVYDQFGIPYIPAKRIKGCIRECALELVEFGVADREDYDTLFGKEGNTRSSFTLGSAYPPSYDDMIEDIESCSDKDLTNSQNVLGLYTYTRTQTAVNRDGIAEPNSLRTIRVVKKGMEFEAELSIDPFISDAQKKLLENAVLLVKHIGCDRTRGLGLIHTSLVQTPEKINSEEKKFEFYEQNKISYSIRLISPMLCKSTTGNQAKTQNYISGSIILGLLAQCMGQDEFKKLLKTENGSLVASNAYISYKKERCIPLRSSLQKVKDLEYNQDGAIRIFDMLAGYNGEEQLTPVGNTYVAEDGTTVKVDLEVKYHHRRPDDKAIGRANGIDNSTFYQLESIQKGQVFSGFLLANREEAEVICDNLKKLKKVHLGYGKSVEYGSAIFELNHNEDNAHKETKLAHDFIIQLNAPTILYTDQGTPLADVKLLTEYLQIETGVNDLILEKAFLNFDEVGGFNVTWKRRKPSFSALGSGTVCRYTSKAGVDLNKLKRKFIGERVHEGYGEIEAFEGVQLQVTLKKMIEEKTEKNQNTTDIVPKLKKEMERKNLVKIARKDASDVAERFEKKTGFDAALSKVILIQKDAEKELNSGNWKGTALEYVKEQINGIEKESKRNDSNEIFEKINEYTSKKSETYFDDNDVFFLYSKEYLTEIKYRIRPNKKERKNG